MVSASMSMQIEYDSAKDRLNREKHGIGLDAASLIFATPSVQWISPRLGHGEVRYVAVGLLDGFEFTCVFTLRDDVARIISLRRPRHEERDRFWKVRRGQIRPSENDS
ncbi:MAG: BrnT family toxin [Alphaproteobacteria bacterium]|nr:BrnT family toxin [Alphaproteobacteria bacterium]